MVKNLPVQSLGGEEPLEKEMATYSRILAWEIAWTEELGGPGRPQSLESQKSQTQRLNNSCHITADNINHLDAFLVSLYQL